MKITILNLTLGVVTSFALLSASVLGQQSEKAQPPEKGDSKVVAAVRGVLTAQVEAWNRGDIEAFMAGYMHNQETVFVSGGDITRGWQTVLDRYKTRYDSREKMGTLKFSELEITPIGDKAAVALGRWELTRANDTPHGLFTLIFRRTPEGWRIVHDHTSSAP